VTIGVDLHKSSLAAAALDELGRVVGVREFPNDGSGHGALLLWCRAQGPERDVGIEGAGTYGAGLARRLLDAGEKVYEVPAKILGEVGDPARIRSKGALAMLTGTAPIEASSGATKRHRLNRGGNRQLNYALHMMARARLRHDDDTKAYVARRQLEGKSDKEATRCLKRHLSNVVFRQLVTDLKGLQKAA